MRLAKDLFGNLSKLTDGNLCDFHLIFSLVILEEIMLITLKVIKIVMLLRIFIGGLVSEDKIDPVMKGTTHLHALKCLTHLEDEFLRRTCPYR